MYMHFHDSLPAELLRAGPLGLLAWQWLALPLLLAFAFLLGSLLRRVLQFALGQLVRRTTSDLDDLTLGRLAGPLTLVCVIAALALLRPSLELAPAALAASS